MPQSYAILTQNFRSLLDFLRFGISQANAHHLYYGHGTDNAEDDIWMLVLGCLNLTPDYSKDGLQARLTEEEKSLLAQKLEQRIKKRIPVPYLTHQSYFNGLCFYVDERVLIPRSPIAELIDQRFSPWVVEQEVDQILDLCTGSGCIAIACAHAFPEAHVDAVDVCPKALEVAEKNRCMHHVEEVVTLIQSDVFQSVPAKKYDIIVSNPPYVGNAEMRTLPEEYLHEPKLALETGKNGLSIVEKILEQAADFLTDEGILVVEVGNSEEALIEAYPNVPFTWLEFEHGGQGVFLLTKSQLLDSFSG